MSCAETAEPIDLLFGLWTRMGPSYHVLDGVQRCWGTLPWQPILGLIMLLTGFAWACRTKWHQFYTFARGFACTYLEATGS